MGVIVLVLCASTASAATVEVYPSDDLWAAIAAAQPGDEVVVHAGTYSAQQPSGSWFREVILNGTESAPIVVRSAEGEVPVIQGDPGASQNTLNLGGTWFTWKGFEMVYGSHGLRVSTSEHGTLEDLHVHDVADVGVSMNLPAATYEAMTVRRVHVHDTSGAAGECFYLGCNDDACQVFDSVIEFNWCHDTLAAGQGDGIELKTGSYGNVVRHNVIHDVRYPGITLYGTFGRAPNEVYGNIVWGSLDNGIQVVGEVSVHDNIVLDSGNNGIQSKPSQGAYPGAMSIVNNTVVGAGDSCLRGNNWDAASDIVVANNVLLCGASYALRLPEGPGSATFVANGVDGVDESPGGSFPVTEAELVDPVSHDVWPVDDASTIDAGDAASAAAEDFNCLPRADDVGAYEWTAGGNPGWVVQEGIKTCATAEGDSDTDADADADTDADVDTDADADTGPAADGEAKQGGCGCETQSSPSPVLAALFLACRRRRPWPPVADRRGAG